MEISERNQTVRQISLPESFRWALTSSRTEREMEALPIDAQSRWDVPGCEVAKKQVARQRAMTA